MQCCDRNINSIKQSNKKIDLIDITIFTRAIMDGYYNVNIAQGSVIPSWKYYTLNLLDAASPWLLKLIDICALSQCTMSHTFKMFSGRSQLSSPAITRLYNSNFCGQATLSTARERKALQEQIMKKKDAEVSNTQNSWNFSFDLFGFDLKSLNPPNTVHRM